MSKYILFADALGYVSVETSDKGGGKTQVVLSFSPPLPPSIHRLKFIVLTAQAL